MSGWSSFHLKLRSLMAYFSYYVKLPCPIVAMLFFFFLSMSENYILFPDVTTHKKTGVVSDANKVTGVKFVWYSVQDAACQGITHKNHHLRPPWPSSHPEVLADAFLCFQLACLG